MAGYWQRPDETAKVMTADGFFRIGRHRGTVDERGYFKIVDRKKDMILVSGFNVYPNEVEDVISQMPGIARVRRDRPARRQSRRGREGWSSCKQRPGNSPKVTSVPTARPTCSQATSGPEDRRVPRRPAQDARRQDPAPRVAGS
jgi:acyl-CoA synthetase (AMP-forming)/AMP-acid ligase II